MYLNIKVEIQKQGSIKHTCLLFPYLLNQPSNLRLGWPNCRIPVGKVTADTEDEATKAGIYATKEAISYGFLINS